MSDRKDKEECNEFFCSQPVLKSATWIYQNWRRFKRRQADASESSSVLPENPLEVPGERPTSHPPEVKKFKISVPQSNFWSKDVLEFYNNGDDGYFYTRFLEAKKLDRSFWGILLGIEGTGSLSPTHVEAWTIRLMMLRHAKLKINPKLQMCWTIMPPQFYDDMKDEKSVAALECAGRKEPYPPFWEVDYVYIPLWIYTTDWLLIRVDMQTMEVTQYWTDSRWRDQKRHAVRHYMHMFSIFFPFFLESINYWRNSDHQTKMDLSVGLTEVDVPQDKGNIANTGVLVCFMMEKLIVNKPLVLENDAGQTCMKYRRKMGDELYKWRWIPN